MPYFYRFLKLGMRFNIQVEALSAEPKPNLPDHWKPKILLRTERFVFYNGITQLHTTRTENLWFFAGKLNPLSTHSVILFIPAISVYFENCGHMQVCIGSFFNFKTYLSKRIDFRNHLAFHTIHNFKRESSIMKRQLVIAPRIIIKH